MAVLSGQIDHQTEKITDLEKTLDSKKEDLKKTENLLQIEMMNRSSLETTKLELMSEISSLKLKQTATEKENSELRQRLQKTLHLSEATSSASTSMDGYRSLPRTPVLENHHRRDEEHNSFKPMTSLLNGGSSSKEMTPTRGATRYTVFFCLFQRFSFPAACFKDQEA